MKKISSVLLFLLLVLLGSCNIGGNKNSNSVVFSLNLPKNFNKMFFIQADGKTSYATQITRVITSAIITVEGPDLKKPIVNKTQVKIEKLSTGTFLDVGDVIVPSGKDRLFTVYLINSLGDVVLAGMKEVPSLPAGKEINIGVDMELARNFKDFAKDFYPQAITGIKPYDLRSATLTWLPGKDVNLVFTFDRNIDLFKGGTLGGLMGVIEIDADGNTATGVPSLVDSLRPQSLGKIGVDYILYIEAFSGSNALLVKVGKEDGNDSETTYTVPMKIKFHHLILQIPYKVVENYITAKTIFYFDAAFITYTSSGKSFADIFPDNKVAVSNDMIKLPFFTKEKAQKITKFKLIHSVPITQEVSFDFKPFQTKHVFGGVAFLSYSKTSTSEVRIRIADPYKSVSFEKSLDRFNTSYLEGYVSTMDDIVVLDVEGNTLVPSCNSYATKAYISFDGGYSFKTIGSWCSGAGEPLLAKSKVIFLMKGVSQGVSNGNSSPAIIEGKVFYLDNNQVYPEGTTYFTLKNVMNPTFFSDGKEFYQAGITIEDYDLSLIIEKLLTHENVFSMTITSVTSPDASAYFYKIISSDDSVGVGLGVWDNYRELSYALIIKSGNDGWQLEKKYTLPNKWIDDILLTHSGPAFVFSEYDNSGEKLVYWFNNKEIPISLLNGSTSYLGSWLIPPATPVIFWSYWRGNGGEHFNISVGMP